MQAQLEPTQVDRVDRVRSDRKLLSWHKRSSLLRVDLNGTKCFMIAASVLNAAKIAFFN